MKYDELYSFGFRIQTVGVKNVDGFNGVVSEIRYFFTGMNKDNITKEIFAVHSLDVNNLVNEQFIPLDQIGADTLHDWLKLSVHNDNLEVMKKDIHLMFNPPIKFYEISHFIPKP
jgi:hypothetical protein